MPTPPLEPVAEPKDEIEATARAGAVALICSFLDGLNSYAYSNRSYLPGDLDATDFMQALSKVKKFCRERPDWTLRVYLHSQKEYQFDYEAGMELKRLQGVVDKFEEWSGLKLDREQSHKNRELAEGVKAILAGKRAKERALKARSEAQSMLRMLEIAVAHAREALGEK